MNLPRRLAIARTATIVMVVLAVATWFAVRAGQPLERGLTIAYGVMALGSLAMSLWFLRARPDLSLARSARLDAWLPDAPFRDTIVVESPAPPPRLMHGTLLALEHRTQPTDAAARRRFARYWLAIRPGGAFVTRQLLKAVARRAERDVSN